MAMHTGFEPASRCRPNAFKASSSPPGHAPYNATGRCRSHSPFPTCSLSKRPPLPIGYCGTYRLRNSNPYLPAENRVSLPLDEGGIAGTPNPNTATGRVELPLPGSEPGSLPLRYVAMSTPRENRTPIKSFGDSCASLTPEALD